MTCVLRIQRTAQAGVLSRKGDTGFPACSLKHDVCFAGGLFLAPFFLCNLLLGSIMENDAQLRQTILDLAQPLLQAQSLSLWGLEIVPGPSTRVCLYVADPEGNATIDQCEAISRQLGLALEVEDCFPASYVLEVSSPGLERKFFQLEQMRPYVGDVIDVRLKVPLPGGERKVWRGRLLTVGSDSFELEPCSVSGEGLVTSDGLPPVTVPWPDVAFVRRVHVFVTPQKPGKKSSRKK